MKGDPTQLDEVFAAAAAETAPGARAAYLDQACHDNPELRQRVEALLAAHDGAGSLLDLPNGEATTPFTSHTQRPGTTIGRYKLLEQIGDGGMGTVWVAQQTEPVRRRVAIKLVKPGMDSRQVLSRFEAERQALAMMDHPNIAKVFDAGMTDQGRPYFVMEYVKGVPLTDYCDQTKLTVQQRLELFIPVCQAVQHAHQKGIIHRDLKPSNILVCLYDGRPVPKVIDFGLAKAIQQPLTEHTLYTAHGVMVGTPLYMSPEQAEFNNLDIDTRTDVYSLGVILYELLTGSTPLDRQRFKDAAWQEIVRVIKEEEPTKPSTKVSGSAALPAIAAQRGLDSAQLSRVVRGDLDWIVMKALEKERSRRYDTANDLARDVERYLHDEPVEARPPSTGYRLRKLARRYRGAVVAGGLIATALLAGSGVAVWQAVRALHAEKVAETRRQEADEARAEAETQRAMAVANSEKARQAVDEYFTLVSENTLLNVPGLQPLRKELLDAALRFYEGLAAEDTNDPAVLADLAVSYMRVAAINRSVDRNDDTAAAIDRALEAIQQLRSRFPDAHQEHRRLAGFWKGIRDLTQTITLPKDPDVVLHSFHRLLELTKTLAEEYPDQIAFRGDLAALYFLTGDLHSDNLQARESLFNFGQAIAVAEQLVREQPNMPEHRADLARAYEQRGRSYKGLGHLNKAEADSAQALVLREQLVAEFPKSPQYRGDLGVSLMQTCGFLIDRDPQQAKQVAGRAKDLFDALMQEYPEAAVYRSELHSAMKWLVVTNIATGTPDQINEGMNLLHEWVATQPDDPRSQIESARMLRDMANRLQANKELHPLIEGTLRNSLATFVELSDQHPDNHEIHEQVGHFHRHLGFNDRDAGRLDEAKHHFEQAVAVFQQLTDADIPQRDGFYRSFLVDSYADLTFVLMQDGKTEYAEAVLTEQLATSIRNHPEHARLLRLRGQLRARLGRWESAAEDFRKLVEIEPDDHWHHFRLATLLTQIGDVPIYHEHRTRALERFGQTDDPSVADITAKLCLILPWPEADFQMLSNLADVALASDPAHIDRPWFEFGKGLVEFRQGNFASAADQMEKVLNGPAVALPWLNYLNAAAYMVLAMARHKLNESEAALAALTHGSELIRAHLPQLDGGDMGSEYHDVIIAHALEREAVELIEETPTQQKAALAPESPDNG